MQLFPTIDLLIFLITTQSVLHWLISSRTHQFVHIDIEWMEFAYSDKLSEIYHRLLIVVVFMAPVWTQWFSPTDLWFPEQLCETLKRVHKSQPAPNEKQTTRSTNWIMLVASWRRPRYLSLEKLSRPHQMARSTTHYIQKWFLRWYMTKCVSLILHLEICLFFLGYVCLIIFVFYFYVAFLL